jgi:hypothetical protein
MGNY